MGHIIGAHSRKRGRTGAHSGAARGTFILSRGTSSAPFSKSALTSALPFFPTIAKACAGDGALGHFYMKLHMVKKREKIRKMKRDMGVYARARAPEGRRHAW